MRSALVLALVCVALGALATVAVADQIILNDGSIRNGKIISVEEDAINVRFSPKTGGTVQMKLPWRKLDRHFFYNLRREKVGDDAKEHLKLALWCIEADLFARAKVHIGQATELDPQLVKDIQAGGKLPEIREGIAKRVLEAAERDLKHEEYEAAERKLEALLTRMPDTEGGTQAAEIYKQLNEKRDAYEAKQEQEKLDKMAEEEQKREKALRKKVEPIKRDLGKAEENLRNGLVEDSESKALKLLQSAISQGGSAIKKIDKLVKDFADDEEVTTRAAEVRKETIDGMVKAHIHRADVYTWRGSTSNAQKEITKARALDPDNPDIAAAEERIHERGNQDALELNWQRNRREGMRFRGGGAFAGARGGGGGRRR